MELTKKHEKLFLRWLPLVLLSIFVLIPILWAISTSLKTRADIFKSPADLIPVTITFENFTNLWVNGNFGQYFLSSIKISSISVAAVVILAIMVGYAMTRYKFKGKMGFLGLLLAVQFIPASVLLVPLFNTFKTLGLLGTHWSIIVVNITFQLPFNAVLMRGFVEGIPYTLEESAMIDGCTRFQGVIKVVLPMLIPGIVTVAAFAFIGCWNEFLFSLMFLNDPKLYTIPIGLQVMQGEYNIDYGSLAAGALIAMSIPVALFAYLQKYLVTGLSAGAVKG